MAERPMLLLGCGILHKEVRHLIATGHWPLDTDFLDSSLHVNLEALQAALQEGLQRHAGREVVVFYGACHPLMERFLDEAHTLRTEGQNCVEMLLGRESFMKELTQGAFFLLEDWALRWDEAIGKTFGNRPEVVREIFQLSCSYLLCLRTPCSGDFTAAAEAVGAKVGLPLVWRDAGLEHLRAVLQQAMQQKRMQREGSPC